MCVSFFIICAKFGINYNTMKNILYVVIVIFLTGCLQAEKDSNTALSNDLGVIKVCKMYSSYFVLLDPNDKGLLIQEFRFNRKGFVNELIRYGIDGEVIGRFDIFGENTPFPMPGQPQFTDTAIIVLDIDSLSEVISKEKKVYNSEGFLMRVEFFVGEDSLTRKNTYKYNSEGYILEDIYWDVDIDKPKQKILYKYEYYSD